MVSRKITEIIYIRVHIWAHIIWFSDNSIDLVKSGLSEYGIDIEDIGQNNNDWSQNRGIIDAAVNTILGSIINDLLDTYSFTVLESPKIITFNSPLG